MSNEYKIRQAIDLVWRNLPDSASTFGDCWSGCGRAARGGGPCLKCAEEALAKLTTVELARKYVTSVMELRRQEQEMIQPKK